MAREITARGVAPLDVKLGNFIRGARTGRLYWIDFEISRCTHSRGGRRISPAHRRLLEELFDLSLHGQPWPHHSRKASEQIAEVRRIRRVAEERRDAEDLLQAAQHRAVRVRIWFP